MSRQNIVDPSQAKTGSVSPRGADRRHQLVQEAFRLIVEKGLEGLRTREVANRAGINQATLHYYFPTKEDLIRGVVDYLIHQFISFHAIEEDPEYSPLELIRAEFAQIDQIFEQPEMVIVLNELALRALRDPATAKLLNQMDEGWHSYLCDILRNGVQQDLFREDLDVDLTATMIMTLLKGIRYETLGKSRQEIRLISQAIREQLEQWLAGRTLRD